MATKHSTAQSPTQQAAALAKRAGGRPSAYSRPLADEICRRLAGGETLTSICKDPHMPDRSTVAGWSFEDRDGFHSVYTRAREVAMDLMAEDLITIAAETHAIVDVEETDPDGKPLLDANGAVKLRKVRVPLSSDVVARNRLRVDTAKWYLAKLAPRRFGDKVTQEHTGPNGGPIALAAVDLKNLSDEELANMQRLLSKVGGGAV
jgi:hypothetical protein